MRFLRPAEKLLQELGVTDPCDIDLEAIAWHRGARVEYRPLDGCEAQIIGYGDKAIIIADESRQPPRRRFSVAHELGHWQHHRGRSFICRTSDIGNYAKSSLDPERVADGYAADLLLPEYLFRPRADTLPNVSIDAAVDLSEEFGTSLTATALRLVAMGPEPSILICHGRNGRKWFRRGPDVPDRWFPCREVGAQSGALDVLYGKEERSRRALTSAGAWFDRRDADSYNVYEQSVRITPTEILSLVVLNDEDMLEE